MMATKDQLESEITSFMEELLSTSNEVRIFKALQTMREGLSESGYENES